MLRKTHARAWMIGGWIGMGLYLGGCLDRIETITVHQDTSADVVSIFKGDAADMNAGDALPTAGRVWRLEETATKHPDGGVKVERVARASIPAGGVIPGTYAADAATAAVALRFPSELTTEVRGDGVYYHFSRVYEGRTDAAYTRTKRSLERDKAMRALIEADVETLTRDDRTKLLDAFRRMELEKHAQYVAAGARALESLPQDTGLRVAAAVVNAGHDFDTSRALDLLEAPETEARNSEIERLAVSFEQTLRDAVTNAIERESLTAKDRAVFLAAYEDERRRREITEDLMDERWEVRLVLPGTVVAHNADAVEAGGVLVWKFDGASLMDVDKEVRATSVVRGAGH
ncbi:MAG: hypothetical protein HBSAPP03_11630 [Phycisphaerae bacterium]|nr:MAG: hypothetical protein HBSAPP03_11630 [Phycisphaerae bacterium]